MDPLQRLTQIFSRFPGIGPRQAQRFVQHLLRSSSSMRRELADAINELSTTVHQCPSCLRFTSDDAGECSICRKHTRDQTILAVVAQDTDIAALERSSTYNGRYFVIGGTISLAGEKAQRIRIPELLKHITSHQKYVEIILALPANPEGDATGIRLKEEITNTFSDVKVSQLGRGFSSGSELEYADSDTLRNALTNRK